MEKKNADDQEATASRGGEMGGKRAAGKLGEIAASMAQGKVGRGEETSGHSLVQ